NTVTLATSPQSATTYGLTVSGVTRQGDGEPLTVATANFLGRIPFDVSSASSVTSSSIAVTFDAPPDPTTATMVSSYSVPGLTLGNYSVAGLTLSGTPSLVNKTVTITTSPQSVTAFTVAVAGIRRASDAEPLTVQTASFTGRAPFNVAGAAAMGSHSITVTFD